MRTNIDPREQFLGDVKSELEKLGIKTFEAVRGLKTHTRERVLYIEPTTSDRKLCVAAGYIIEKRLTKIYFGWRANPAHFLDFAADNVRAHSYSNGKKVLATARSKFPGGNHGSVGVWIVDQYVSHENAAELAKRLRDIS